jgi:hypothetical protein
MVTYRMSAWGDASGSQGVAEAGAVVAAIRDQFLGAAGSWGGMRQRERFFHSLVA